jgi:hypothetical protein
VLVISAVASAIAITAVSTHNPTSIRRWSTPTTMAESIQPEPDRALVLHAEPAPALEAPPCPASRVEVEFVRTGHAVGNDWLAFRLTNVGTEDCQLAGNPLVTAQLSGFEPVVASRGVIVAGWPQAGPAATLPPGEGANLSVILNAPCQRQRPSPGPASMPLATLRLALPDEVIDLPIPDTVGETFRPNGVCSFSVSGFERWRPVAR